MTKISTCNNPYYLSRATRRSKHLSGSALGIGLAVSVCLPFALTSSTFFASTVRAYADEPAAVTLTASPGIILADGKSTTTIAALATFAGGKSVPDGTTVQFSSTSGTLSAPSVLTEGGVARVTLTSSALAGNAIISATFVAQGVGATQQMTVEFTNDTSLANTDQSQEGWVHVSSRDYIGYGADSKTVDAYGKKQGVRFSYEGVTIDADSMQVDLANNTVRARNAIVTRDRQVITTADELYYEYTNHSGYVVVTDGPTGDVSALRLIGVDLKTDTIPEGQAPPSNQYDFSDLSQDHVMITASSIDVRPGDQIRFRRATIFVDGKKIVSMPIHIMPLNSTQVFGQQVLGYGTSGFYLNVPYYASATSTTTDTFNVRSLAASQAAGTFDTQTSTGLSLDFEHDYKTESGTSDGALQFYGLTRGEQTGLRWRHNETFGPDTKLYLYADSPDRNNYFTTQELTQNFKSFSVNVTNSYSDSFSNATVIPASSGIVPQVVNSSIVQQSTDAYATTTPRKVLGSGQAGLQVVYNAGVNEGTETEKFQSETLNIPTDTRSLGSRFFTSPITLVKATTLTDSLNVAGTYDRYAAQSALTLLGNLGLDRKLSTTTNLGLNYTYNHNPFNETFAYDSNGYYIQKLADVHTFGASFFTGTLDQKWTASIISSLTEPTNDESIFSGLDYNFATQWKFGLTNSISRASGFYYQDYGLLVGRKFLGRELDFSWSAVDHHLRFNLDSASF